MFRLQNLWVNFNDFQNWLPTELKCSHCYSKFHTMCHVMSYRVSVIPDVTLHITACVTLFCVSVCLMPMVALFVWVSDFCHVTIRLMKAPTLITSNLSWRQYLLMASYCTMMLSCDLLRSLPSDQVILSSWFSVRKSRFSYRNVCRPHPLRSRRTGKWMNQPIRYSVIQPIRDSVIQPIRDSF